MILVDTYGGSALHSCGGFLEKASTIEDLELQESFYLDIEKAAHFGGSKLSWEHIEQEQS